MNYSDEIKFSEVKVRLKINGQVVDEVYYDVNDVHCTYPGSGSHGILIIRSGKNKYYYMINKLISWGVVECE